MKGALFATDYGSYLPTVNARYVFNIDIVMSNNLINTIYTHCAIKFHSPVWNLTQRKFRKPMQKMHVQVIQSLTAFNVEASFTGSNRNIIMELGIFSYGTWNF